MPHDHIEPETDGNPDTIYEDTNAHERLGFRVDDKTQLNIEEVDERIPDGIDI
ncbi:hypothetical protein J31TS4_02980 [Paenibacillus sp. J31TS4]|uniref:hypothetical protein n=1 Tax=Paenibacillus sp. J31TS4 TaxID=2807195 RepID=UPI001B15713A|nr:hypothetical protein [Paenibacillus sp. J31TS4]GIP37018.1 hypothetical protein J31TS4_02980 [Paenibacillus sp. J31TS4]